MTEHQENKTELADAARRASPVAGGYADMLVESAERQAIEIRREARSDAERVRQEALDSAKGILERIEALDRPLGELMLILRGEVERASHELDPPVEADAAALPGAVEPEPENMPDPPEHLPARLHVENLPRGRHSGQDAPPRPSPGAPPYPEREPAHPGVEDPPEEKVSPEDEMATLDQKTELDEQEAPPGDQFEREDAPRVPAYHDPQAASPPKAAKAVKATKTPKEKGERRPFGRIRRAGGAKGVFVTKQGNCTVCQRAFMAGSEENLRLSGWRVDGEVGVCPDCQNDGWQLPEGARRPFRRADA